jgi:hypothetical protein
MKNCFKNYFLSLLSIFIFSCDKFKTEDNKNPCDNIMKVYDATMQFQKYIYQSWGSKLNLKTQVQDADEKTLLLGDIFKNESKLVLRITDIDCNPCIEHALKLLKSSEKKIQQKVVVLVSSSNIRHFRIFAEKVKPFEIYAIDFEKMKIPIEIIGKPYLFVMTPNNDMPICYFVPVEGISQPTKNYMDVVEKKINP